MRTQANFQIEIPGNLRSAQKRESSERIMMSNHVAMITGASSGIGADLARELATTGYDLLLIARREEKLKTLAGELLQRNPGRRVYVLKSDLSSPAAADKILHFIHKNRLDIEILINNAAAALQHEFHTVPFEQWHEQIQLNILSFSELTHKIIPLLLKRSSGHIVNIASAGAFQPLPWYALYGACKAYMLSLSAALHRELKPYNIHVTCICPGAVSTDFNRNAGIEETIGPSFAWMTPDRVAKLSLRAMKKKKSVYIPGWFNKINIFAERFLPRQLVTRLAGSLYEPKITEKK